MATEFHWPQFLRLLGGDGSGDVVLGAVVPAPVVQRQAHHQHQSTGQTQHCQANRRHVTWAQKCVNPKSFLKNKVPQKKKKKVNPLIHSVIYKEHLTKILK